MNRKKRILFCSEATFLNTGYATYTREILNYLHGTGKYELAEMASYGERNDPRANNIPWKYYGVVPNQNCEPKASEQELREYQSKPTNQFGEMLFEHVCLDFLPDIVCDIRDFWMCLTPRTNIICKNGIKHVKDIKAGDTVLTHNGRYRKVIQTFKRDYFGDLHTINVMNCPFNVELTDDHPVYALKRSGTNNLPTHLFEQKNLQWINSQDIEKNDILVYPIDEEGINNLETDFCRMLGYYMAEGCLMYEGLKEDNKLKGIQLTFNAQESSHINDFIECVDKYYGIKSKTKIVGGAVIVRCFGEKIAKDCLKYCGSLAGDKILHQKVFYSNNKCIRSFLCGLFRGDGGYYTDKASYCTKSEQLAHQVFRLCLRLGILPSFNLNKNKIAGVEKTYWRYLFSFRSTSLHGFVSIYNNNLDKHIKPAKRIKNGYAWLTVRDVMKQTYGETVHNFEVEEDNTYVSSFCIHNCDHEERSPLRPYYKWVLMPTVDAAPQARQWVATYQSADACLTYSDWAGGVLTKQSGGKINYQGSAPPSAHPAYKPVKDKDAHRKKFGLDPDMKIIGTVMRNQRRKLYPDLFDAFKKFISTPEGENAYLYCHTSYPDLGWDIPELLQEYGLSSRVYFTYICPETKKPFPSLFRGPITQSPYTGKFGAGLSNVKIGASYEDLSDIMNLFDLYVQYANCEGFGLPQVEAAACAVPVMGTDYSAMESVLRKLQGFPIKPKALYKELETGCMRAVPDNDLAAKMFSEFFSKSKEEQRALGEQSRLEFERYYQWDLSGQQWEKCFDLFDVEPIENTWGRPANIRNPASKPQLPEGNLNYKEIARWLIGSVLCDESKMNTFLEARLVRDLTYHTSTATTGGMYFNESSAAFDGQSAHQPFSFDMAYDHFKQFCNHRNIWEQRRVERMKYFTGS